MRFKEKVVVVTGGGSGIGRETAFEFGREGATVAVSDIDQATAEGTASEIVKRGGKAEGFQLDTTDPAAVTTMFETAERRFGGLDVLINSAGVREISPVTELSYEEWSRVINVNITGVFLWRWPATAPASGNSSAKR